MQSMPVRLSALEWMTDTLEAYPFFRSQVEQILAAQSPREEPPADSEAEALGGKAPAHAEDLDRLLKRSRDVTAAFPLYSSLGQ